MEADDNIDSPDTSFDEDNIFHGTNDEICQDDGDDNWEDIIEIIDSGEASSDSNQNTKAKELNNNKGSKTKLEWKGQELFIPTGKNVSSQVWKHGGWLKDENGEIDKSKIICSHCGKKISYNSSPSTFETHLTAKHFTEYNGSLEAENNKQAKIGDFFTAGSNVTKYPAKHPKQKAFRAALVRFVIRDKRPLSTPSGKGFIDLMMTVDPRLTVPSRDTIRRDINKLYTIKKRETIEKFKNVEYFACTNDAGTSLSNHSFLDINLHWIDEDFNMQKKVIDVKHIDSKKAVDYRKEVDDSIKEHGVADKVTVFVTDNEPTMKLSFDSTIRNGCMPHIQSKASQKALESSQTLKKIRKKLRKVASKANKSPKFKLTVDKKQKEKNLRPHTIKQEMPTRFTATHTMFRSILNDPNENTSDDIDEEAALSNKDAVNDAMKDTLP